MPPLVSSAVLLLSVVTAASALAPSRVATWRPQPQVRSDEVVPRMIRLARRSPSSPDEDPSFSPVDGCSGTLPLSTFTRLNAVCEDCYGLYRQPEVYTLCRSSCFGTPFFATCMETLLVPDDVRSEVAAYLQRGASNFYNKRRK